MRAALFLDRDGTILEEVDFLCRPEDVRVVPGAAETIAALARRGVPVVVVTNQSGIGRGYFSEADFHAVNRAMAAELARAGAALTRIYFCPDTPDRATPRRKPGAGMLLEAAAELDVDLGVSALVGDKLSDLLAARAAGCAAVLVRTGYGRETEARLTDPAVADAVFDSLGAARGWLEERLTRRQP